MKNYELTKTGDSHYVTLAVLIPERVDLQNDIVSAREIEKAIERFNAGPKHIYKNHRTAFSEDEVEVTESFQSPVDMNLGGNIVPAGSWIIKCRVNQEVYELAKRGQLVGTSVGGKAEEQY